MAKVIEFYLHGPVPKKVKPVPIEQRGKLVEFPKEQLTAQSKTEDTTVYGRLISASNRNRRASTVEALLLCEELASFGQDHI